MVVDWAYCIVHAQFVQRSNSGDLSNTFRRTSAPHRGTAEAEERYYAQFNALDMVA
jgi:hypothetical protein